MPSIRSLPVLLVLVALVMGAAGSFLWIRSSRPSVPAQQPEETPPPLPSAKSSPATSHTPPNQPVVAPPPPPVAIPADYLESLRQSPEQQAAEEIALNLRNFGARFGGNPTGSNAEIVKTLNGGNPQGVRYLPEQLLRLNDQGELVDNWGTPYFFHQLSAQETEIRSAGPDKTLWTQDDLVTK